MNGDANDRSLPLPAHRDIYYGGAWHAPMSGDYAETISPGTGGSLGRVANGSAADVDAAVAAAARAFADWRDVAPLERARTAPGAESCAATPRARADRRRRLRIR